MSKRCEDWDSDWGGCGSCSYCLAERAANGAAESNNRLERIEEKLDRLLAALEPQP